MGELIVVTTAYDTSGAFDFDSKKFFFGQIIFEDTLRFKKLEPDKLFQFIRFFALKKVFSTVFDSNL